MAESTENGEELKTSDDPRYAGFTKAKRPMNIEDRMHGFLFFSDIVHDFKHFEPNDIDHLQRANVPLLERERKINDAKSPVLIMTDYGSCVPHEAIQGSILPKEDYFVQFWQHIDVFCYFAHGHIAIPPPTWINAAHRNGVQVIGTLIFEQSRDKKTKELLDDKQTSAMLETDSNGKNWLADKLAHVAAICGFDGWLLNIESSVLSPENGKSNPWNGGEGMIKFITQLREGMAKYNILNGGKVIWYDAVTKYNVNDNQRGLNDNYLMFARAAGSVIVDYPLDSEQTWTEVPAQAQLADAPYDTQDKKNLRLGRENVYLGRRLFRNMGNGKAMEPVAKERVGSGFFATGWCFQKFFPPEDTATFTDPTFRSKADRCMWTGEPGLTELFKAKYRGDFDDHGQTTNAVKVWADQLEAKGGITAHAREYAAGSSAFFFTNYGTAVTYRKQTNDFSAHLNEQSVWPNYRASPPTNPPGSIKTELKGGSSGGCGVSIKLEPPPATLTGDVTGHVFLHHVHLKHDSSLTLTMRYIVPKGMAGLQIWACVWADIRTATPTVEVKLSDTAQPTDLTLSPSEHAITAIGLRVVAPASLFAGKDVLHLLDIRQILVKPQHETYGTSKLANVELVQDAAQDGKWMRLKWNAPSEQNPGGHLPWSKVTGSFSHFDIYFDSKSVARSHTLSYVWDEEDAAKFKYNKGASVEVKISGTRFDGSYVAELFKGQKAWP